MLLAVNLWAFFRLILIGLGIAPKGTVRIAFPGYGKRSAADFTVIIELPTFRFRVGDGQNGGLPAMGTPDFDERIQTAFLHQIFPAYPAMIPAKKFGRRGFKIGRDEPPERKTRRARVPPLPKFPHSGLRCGNTPQNVPLHRRVHRQKSPHHPHAERFSHPWPPR